MGFLLKAILIFIVISYVLKVVARLLFPFMFRQVIKNMNQQTFRNTTEPRKKEGDVTVINNKQTNNPKRDLEGEYTDYEEIK